MATRVLDSLACSFCLFLKHPDGKMMQIMLTGFLGKTRARTFMTDLIELLTSAMESPDGIPNELVELKKLELQKKKVCMDAPLF